MTDKSNLAALSDVSTRRQAITGVARAFGGLAVLSTQAWAGAGEEISHTAESIHQEVVFKASRKRVCETLTDSKQFERVVQLSDAMKTRMPAGAPPTQISSEAGGSFSTFGGLIVGRPIELVPNARIVQVGRPAYWDPGVFSIVKLELKETGSDTKLILDHKGFPDGDAKSLLDGWNENYWEPLAKYLL